MYENILFKPLRLRQNVSFEARMLLNKVQIQFNSNFIFKNQIFQLLQKNPQIRLGSGERDVLDIKEEDFFASIDWEELETGKSPTPYNPNVVSTRH